MRRITWVVFILYFSFSHFLPEVWESFRTKDEFLSALCEQKAGLSRNCWQDKKTNIEVFTTTHFSEQKKADH